MLEIKDNIDLQELEKFGFEYEYEENWDGDYWEWCDLFVDNQKIIGISATYNYEVQIYNFDQYQDIILNTLFDLIQAGLIKKVVKYDNQR